MARSQWFWLALLSLLWGGSFFFVGVAVKEVPVFTLVLARVGLGALVLAPIVLAMGQRFPVSLVGWQPFVGMAILNNVIPFTLIASGQSGIASGLASVLNATTPVWSVVLAWAIVGEAPAHHRAAGVLLGLAGVAVLVGPDALSASDGSTFAMLLCLGGALSYGFSGLWGRRLARHSPLLTSAAQLIASTIMLAPVALIIDPPWTLPLPSTPAVASIVGLAIFSTALAYLVFFHVMKVSGPLNAMLVTLLIPVSAVALGTLVLDEALLARQMAGALTIGAALLAIDGRPLGWFARITGRRPRQR